MEIHSDTIIVSLLGDMAGRSASAFIVDADYCLLSLNKVGEIEMAGECWMKSVDKCKAKPCLPQSIAQTTIFAKTKGGLRDGHS